MFKIFAHKSKNTKKNCSFLVIRMIYNAPDIKLKLKKNIIYIFRH